MSFQVVNGSIPQAVEQFLRDPDHLEMRVFRRPYVSGVWGLDWAIGLRGSSPRYFDWPHDRAPTLQEAIEAVVFQREEVA